METFGGRPLETSLLGTGTRQALVARSGADAALGGASAATGEQAPVGLVAPPTLAAAGQQLSGAASRHLQEVSETLTAEAASQNIARQTDHLKRIVASDTTTTAQQHNLAESLLSVKSTNFDYFNCVNNFNSLKLLVAENMFELILICVIVIYLVYYFSKISRRPKLLGQEESPFVRFINSNFESTLKSRFSPLIYFWGTNPQTALFGYLQGQTSNDEMPRNKFKRQYLYVSDLQYLASNVDLSKYYIANLSSCARSNRRRQAQQQQVSTHHKLVQLDAGKLMADSCPEEAGLVCKKNIRFTLDQMAHQFACNNNNSGSSSDANCDAATATNCGDERRILVHSNKCHSSDSVLQNNTIERPKSLLNDGSDSTASSSSDSGVFANGSLTASSVSSSSSSSSLAIDMSSVQCDKQKCSCAALYESNLNQFEVFENQQRQPVAPAQAVVAQTNQVQELKSEQFEFGQCALDWYRESHRHYHKNKLIALISAGMTTGSDKKYVTDTVQTLEKLGYEVCVFIRRGVGGLRLCSSRFFSPSKWRDFEAAILSIRKQRPDARIVAIGFSFGSIELCRYLSMSGNGSLVSAALLISCPFDPEAGGRNMRKRALNRKIDAYLAKNLGKQLHQALAMDETNPRSCNSSTTSSSSSSSANQNNSLKFFNHNGSLVDLSLLPKIKSLVDFEDNYNRVIQNYPNSEAYAADSRLHDYLDNIKTPTLCLSSEDDFMAPTRLLPIKQIQANKNLCMLLTKRGGHMAFVDGLFWPKKPYFAQRIIGKYMEAMKVQLETVAQNGRPSFCESKRTKACGENNATSRQSNNRTEHVIKPSARNLLNMFEDRRS